MRKFAEVWRGKKEGEKGERKWVGRRLSDGWVRKKSETTGWRAMNSEKNPTGEELLRVKNDVETFSLVLF